MLVSLTERERERERERTEIFQGGEVARVPPSPQLPPPPPGPSFVYRRLDCVLPLLQSLELYYYAIPTDWYIFLQLACRQMSHVHRGAGVCGTLRVCRLVLRYPSNTAVSSKTIPIRLHDGIRTATPSCVLSLRWHHFCKVADPEWDKVEIEWMGIVLRAVPRRKCPKHSPDAAAAAAAAV